MTTHENSFYLFIDLKLSSTSNEFLSTETNSMMN